VADLPLAIACDGNLHRAVIHSADRNDFFEGAPAALVRRWSPAATLLGTAE